MRAIVAKFPKCLKHMISTIVYDVDQTVLNSQRYNFSSTFTKEMGIPADAMTPFFKGVFRTSTIGKTDVKEVILPFLKEWNWKGTVDELLAYWFAAENSIDTELIEHVRGLRRKGLRCFLATDNERRRTEYLWNTLGLTSEFDDIFSSSHVGFTKGEEGFWSHVWEKLGRKEKQSILFWDDDKNNVETAQNFGFLAEHYTDFSAYKERMTQLCV